MGRKRKVSTEIVYTGTPERLERAVEEAGQSRDAWEDIDPSRIDSRNEIRLVRRFKATHLDRFYSKDDPKRSKLTFRQYYAGDWYRNTHARAGYSFSCIASYGERVSGSEPSYGLARTERQADARKLWREAKEQFPSHMRGFMDMLLLHDEIPGYAGTRAGRRGREAILREICFALDELADWLKLAREPKAA